ncbi:MAG: 4Fe-4S dicluster domain-containing protein, partial [Bacteroidales bacterium]|nr:4Fe-4S dicluster domain-containing protein [Bacteroidales bacterium]
DFGVIENGNIVLLDNAAQNGFNQLKHLVIILDINNFVIKQDHLDFLLYVKGLKKPFTDIKVVSSAYKKIESTPFFSTDTTIDEMEVPVTVFLVDNGITEILKDPFFKPVLYCIDCGICGQVCPVSQLHKNETPIGLVKKFLNPQVNKKQNIAQFTTLCGNCAKECPIHIPITDMMRHEVHLSGNTGFISRAAYKFKYFFNRNKMNKLNDKIYRYLFINKQFGQNSILKTYFLNQKTSFFNIQQKDNASE